MTDRNLFSWWHLYDRGFARAVGLASARGVRVASYNLQLEDRGTGVRVVVRTEIEECLPSSGGALIVGLEWFAFPLLELSADKPLAVIRTRPKTGKPYFEVVLPQEVGWNRACFTFAFDWRAGVASKGGSAALLAPWHLPQPVEWIRHLDPVGWTLPLPTVSVDMRTQRCAELARIECPASAKRTISSALVWGGVHPTQGAPAMTAAASAAVAEPGVIRDLLERVRLSDPLGDLSCCHGPVVLARTADFVGVMIQPPFPYLVIDRGSSEVLATSWDPWRMFDLTRQYMARWFFCNSRLVGSEADTIAIALADGLAVFGLKRSGEEEAAILGSTWIDRRAVVGKRRAFVQRLAGYTNPRRSARVAQSLIAKLERNPAVLQKFSEFVRAHAGLAVDVRKVRNILNV